MDTSTPLDPRPRVTRAEAAQLAKLPYPEQTPLLSWAAFRASFVWNPGEHVTCVGPTGCGKTTTQLALLRERRYVTMLATKPVDRTLDRFGKDEGYTTLRRWRNAFGAGPQIKDGRGRFILWPPYKGKASEAGQRDAFEDALGDIFTRGGFTVCADELWYLCAVLGLENDLRVLWSQGRSVGISLMGGTQRPRHVPLMAYDQASHLLMWRDNDDENLRRVGGLGGLSSKVIRETVALLPRHWFLYVNTRDGALAVTKAEG